MVGSSTNSMQRTHTHRVLENSFKKSHLTTLGVKQSKNVVLFSRRKRTIKGGRVVKIEMRGL